MPKQAEKVACPKCGKQGVYFRKDGSIRCTKCNYEGQIKVVKK